MRRVIYLLATTLLAGAAVAGFPQALKTKESAAARNTLFGRNLIVNGDAEMGETGEGKAKGWAPQGDVEIENYGHVAGEWDWNAPGAPNGGQNYFRIAVGGVAETKTVSQVVDVSGAAKEIDAGAAEFTASGYFGEIKSEHGTMILNVAFLDAADKTLGQAATEPVVPDDLPPPQTGEAAMTARTVSGAVPAGTRRIRVQLTAKYLNYAECNNCETIAFADNLSLVLVEKKAETNRR